MLQDANAPAGDDDELLARLKKWVSRDREAHAKFLEEAEECYRFIAGHQWTDEQIRELEDKQRPPVVFNRIAPIMRAVTGTEIASRATISYRPRELSDGGAAEVWTEALRWYRDNADAEDEETDAFLDAAACGLGWIETTLDFDADPEGEPRIKRVSPLAVIPDCNATERNLADMRRVSHIERMPLAEARELFPDAEDEDLDAAWLRLAEDEADPVDREKARRYASEEEPERREDDLVTVVRCQWRERVRVVETADPMTGEPMEISPEEFEILQQRAPMVGMPPPQGRMRRKTVYRQAFIGRKILRQTDAPFQGGFSFEAITAFRDQVERTWYGLVRGMMDPQRFANKWLSTTMHIMSSGAKGGIFMEEDSVDDMREFEESYAQADAVTKVRPGAMVNGKIQPKPQTAFPAGFYELMNFAVDSVRQISGVSQEMMGTREVDQPGILEQQRRTQGLVMLNSLFSALRRYRKRVGRTMLEMMKEYIDPQRLMRILGPNLPPQVVQMAYQAEVEYDVVVEESPTSANQKELVWSLMSPILGDLPPQVQAELWAYSPLPESVAQKVRQGYQAALQPPPPSPAEQAEAAKIQAQAAKDGATAEKTRAELDKVRSEIAENVAQAAQARADAAKTEIEAMRLGAQPVGRPMEYQSASTVSRA